MAFSMANVLSSLVESTVRTPRAVQLPDAEDLYKPTAMQRPSMHDMMPQQGTMPMSAADDGKSEEQREHDTLSRIRDALYRDQQS